MTRPATCFVKSSRRSTSRLRDSVGTYGSTERTRKCCRREAEALIEPKEANEAVENKSRTGDEPEHPSTLNGQPDKKRGR